MKSLVLVDALTPWRQLPGFFHHWHVRVRRVTGGAHAFDDIVRVARPFYARDNWAEDLGGCTVLTEVPFDG